MKHQLYLVRHGEAEPYHLLGDHQRSLTHTGQQEAARAGQLLQKKGVQPTLIVHSNAVRTTMTAEMIASQLQPSPRLQVQAQLYNARLQDWRDIIGQLAITALTVIMVGHNMGISEFARFLYGNPLPDMQTCGIYGFELAGWGPIYSGEARLIFRP